MFMYKATILALTVTAFVGLGGLATAQQIDTLCGGPVVIPEGFPTPLPVTSQVVAAAIPDNILNVGVILTDFLAPRPDDIDMILIHPNTTSNLEFWSDVGGIGATDLTGSNVDIDDAGGVLLPNDGPISGGTVYKPSDVGLISTPPASYGLAGSYSINHPAPNASATFASAFNGLDPNGTWELRGVDDTGTAEGPTASVADWCVVITTGELLPVELTSFEAVINESDVRLTWTTSTETDNAGFEIQRYDAGEFVAVAFVEGAGSTTSRQDYSYVVEDLSPGPQKFRLSQVDFDGAFEYSETVEVFIEIPGGYDLSAPFPNPFNSRAEFTLLVAEEQEVQIVAYDAIGRSVSVLHDGPLSSDRMHRFEFTADDLPGGIYFVRVVGQTFSEIQRLMLVR
jgi:hypothetical protein